MASRRRIVVLSSAFTLLAIGVFAGLAAVGVTQTAYGRGLVRDFVQRELAGRVNGTLHVGRITGGLLTGVTVDSLEIRGPDDALFVASGPITLHYDPRDIIDRRILLRHVEVQRPIVHLREYDDGDWNYRQIFRRGPPRPPGVRTSRGFGDFIVIDSADVRGGQFLLSLPWQPSDSLRGIRRDSAIVYNVARVDAEIRPVHEGFSRTWRWSEIEYASSGIRLSDPDNIGRRFGIASLAVVEADPPFHFRNVRGEVLLLGDTAFMEVPHFDLPGSTGRGRGKVVWGGGLPVRYDIRVEGDSVSLADISWVYETLPRTGGGSMRLHIRNDPDNLRVIDYALTDLDVQSTGSRLRGAMTYGVGGPALVVKDVDLQADPVDFDLLRTLAGGPFSYDWQGTLSGMVRGRGGRLDRFRVDSANVVFRDAHVPGAITRGWGRGELDILDPAFTVFRNFFVEVDQLDLRTPQFLNEEFPRLAGTVRGRAVLDSSWLDVRFRDADLVHLQEGAEPSRFTGNGRVTLADDFVRYDVDLVAQPIAFSTFARSYEGLPLRGSYQGPLRVRGTLADLAIEAEMSGPAGTLVVDGRFGLFGPAYTALGTAVLRRVDLARLLEREDVLATDLSMQTEYDLRGSTAEDLSGTLHVVVDRSLVDSLRIYPSIGRFAFGDGRARVDTLRLESALFELSAAGGLGLVPSQPDSLDFHLALDSLGALRRYLGTTGAGASVDSLHGLVTVRGTAAGTTEGIALAGSVAGRSIDAVGLQAERMDGTFALHDVLGDRRGVVTLLFDTLTAGGLRFRGAEVNAEVLGPAHTRLRLEAASTTGPRALLGAAVHREDARTVVLLDTLALAVGENRWELERTARIVGDSNGLMLDTIAVRGQRGGRVMVGGLVPLTDSISLAVRADGVPLVDLGLLAQSATSLDGSADFALDVRGTRAAPTMAFTGVLAGAQFGDVRLARLSAQGSYAAERLRAALLLSRANAPLLRADAELPLDLTFAAGRRRILDAPLRGNIRSEQVDLALLEGFSTAIRQASGTFRANLDLGGTFEQPELSGTVEIANGAMLLPNLGDVRLRRLNTELHFLGDSLAIRRLEAASGSQRNSMLSLTGGIGFSDYENPRFDLTLSARNFHVIAKPRVADLDVSTSPVLRLTGPLTGATLTGGLRVERGIVYLPEFTRKQVIDLDDPEFFNVVDTTVFANRTLLPNAPPTLVRNLTLREVAIEMGDDVWLRGPEARINLGGRVNLMTARDLRTRGENEAKLALDGILTANRGTYRLNLGVVQRTFTIERGALRFFGEPDLNPTLDIVAAHTVRQFDRQTARQDVTVVATIGGTLVNPQLRLSAADNGLDLSESDAISYLVTGAPSFAVGGAQSSELTAARVALSSLGSYLGDRAAGGFFDVVQFQTSGLEEGDTRGLRSAGRSILSGTRLGLGVQLSDRTFVSANAGLCQLGNVVGGERFNATDFAESIGVKVDYRLGGGLGLSAGVEPPTRQLYCTQEFNPRGFAPTPRQWAFDLFRTWRF